MNVKLVSITEGQQEFKGKSAEDIIVYAARVSSSKEDKFEKPEGLIKYCINKKHWSIFETATMTVEIQTSKAIGIQLLRHKSFSFQEFSQRYSVVTEIEPIELRKQAASNRQSSEEVFDPILEHLHPVYDDFFSYTGENPTAKRIIENHIDVVKDLYNSLLQAGVAKECARMILPMATQTTIYMTGSIRSWIHFLAIRDDAHAQLEVQLIAKKIKDIFKQQLPIISHSLNF